MNKPLPFLSPQKLKESLSQSPRSLAFIEQARTIHKEILSGKDSRKVLIVGPCSIHHLKSALDYAAQLKELTEEVSDAFVVVMRVYVEKARTTTGWKGFLYDPYLDGSGAIETGLIWTRKLLLTLAEMGVACATEFVDPLTAPYFEDLISWGFIGARTSSSPTHRQLASSLSMPIGFKNSLQGQIETAAYAVLSAAQKQVCLSMDQRGCVGVLQTQGNAHTHIVLRGSCHKSNYDSSSVAQALHILKGLELPQRVMIDCSHGNAQKLAERQKIVFENVIEQIVQGNHSIFGVMLESHLESGNQPMRTDSSELHYGVSITDPCLGWRATENLIRAAHRTLQSKHEMARYTHST